MRIAIVGGGAAGTTLAWLLDADHQVTLFEAAPVLGGHIRTLGGNVPSERLPRGLAVDTGVIEFEASSFPLFMRLMGLLGVALREVPATTALFLPDGRVLRSPHNIRLSSSSLPWRLTQYARNLPLHFSRFWYRRRSAHAAEDDLYAKPLGAYLPPSLLAVWLRVLLTYAYSTPYPATLLLPADLALPTLHRMIRSTTRWVSVVGGSSAYIDRMAQQLRGEVRCNAQVKTVRRTPDGVVLHADRGDEHFDAVVFATTPEQVLALLTDPSATERQRFGAWRSRDIHTVLHTDPGLFEPWGATFLSEFDLFVEADGNGGYNAYLNRLCGLPTDHPPHYCLALNLSHRIDPATVLHTQRHTTPDYTVAALRHRREIRRDNGTNHTWFAGAWLWDGLHEGAIRSADEVSRRLGSRTLS